MGTDESRNGTERNGTNRGRAPSSKIVLNRLCTVSNFHTITKIVLELVRFCYRHGRKHLLDGFI